MKQIQRTGLHLQGKRITEISGPTKLCYLKPPGPRKGKVDLPYILLFSDSHFSSENQCRSCDAPSCYRLYTKEFVQLLDGLAKEVPIDFYLEMGDLFKDKPLNLQGGPLAYDMIKLVRHCGPKGLPLPEDEKEASNVACPTQYLRWHDSDPRTMDRGVESRLFNPFMEYMVRVNNLLHHYGFYDPKQDPPLFKERHAPLWKHTFSTLFSRLDIPTKTHRIITEIVTSLHTTYKDTSLIDKQYKKSYLSDWMTYDDLVPLIIDSLLAYPSYQEHILFLDGAIRYEKDGKNPYPEWVWVRNYIFSLIVPEKRPPPPAHFSQYNVNTIKHFASSINTILLIIQMMFVDLYTLFRMFKTPSGGVPGSLALGNFGAKHVEMITIFLTHPLFGYQVQYETKERYALGIKNTKYAIRCQRIEREVPLEDDVREHYRLQTLERASLSSAPAPSPSPKRHTAGVRRNRKKKTVRRKTVRRR